MEKNTINLGRKNKWDFLNSGKRKKNKTNFLSHRPTFTVRLRDVSYTMCHLVLLHEAQEKAFSSFFWRWNRLNLNKDNRIFSSTASSKHSAFDVPMFVAMGSGTCYRF